MARYGLVTVAFNEERFIKPFLSHIPKWVDEKLVLVSIRPWHGRQEIPDETDLIAEQMGATVICYDWKSEEEQRQAGQDYFHDFDWVIVLDPDEYLTKADWKKLKEFLDGNPPLDAYVTGGQLTYWKRNLVIHPPEDYKQIIAVRPRVRFVDKRVVDCAWYFAPTLLHHMSWARTDDECYSKITHYAHAREFDTEKWFNEVWKSDQTENLHPLTPDALKQAVPAKLPAELERLDLWPPTM